MVIYLAIARAATTHDVFNAIAEVRRRNILAVLARGERVVGEIVSELGIPQPSVSKHLGVLREVGLVAVARRGRERVYRVEAEGLRAVHEWTSEFERLWDHQIHRITQRAEARAGASVPATETLASKERP